MTVTDLQRLYDHHVWANRQLFAVLEQLTTDEFVRNVAGSYGSIQNTLVHTMSAEWGWLDRCGGTKRGDPLKAEDYPNAASLIARWAEVDGHVRAFLATLSDADMNRPITFALGGGPAQTQALGQLLQHGATHAVHHRGQVSLLLRMLGHAPGNFDLVIYNMDTPRP